MFIYTLPLFFTEISWTSPVELLMVVIALLLVLFLSAPACADNLQQLSLNNYLFSAWVGIVLEFTIGLLGSTKLRKR